MIDQKGINFKVSVSEHIELKKICAIDQITLQQYLKNLVEEDFKKRGVTVPIIYDKKDE